MHKKFDHQSIEKKWQKDWKETGIYTVGDRDTTKDKEYVLVEWPYPSGNLHIGHWFAFAVVDMYVRKRRMDGKQVLFPIGFDAFGLPAENAAIKRGLDPKAWTESNIEFMKGQLENMGNAFSWDKTTSSTDPEYYKWTQWMFTEFFRNNIAYRGKGKVNWCPGCHTVLANEQVLPNGTCERSGDVIEQREMSQWMLRITKYADELIDDLDALDWPEHIKQSQRNWIGRSKGARITFTLSNGDSIEVFTTRPDTLFGATYVVLAPEHAHVETLKKHISNVSEVEAYQEATRKKKDEERTAEGKEKTGVKLHGITATNPATKEEIPVFISDYVISTYGTGALMAVPAHDERDFEFAQKFALPIRQVVARHFDLGVKEGVETLERGDVVDLIIEHPTDGTFLLEREKSLEGDHVHFVGGGTEGENHELAIARELLEETGFSDFEIVAGPVDIQTCFAYRHTKNKNQRTKSHFYHIKLKALNQAPSEIDEGQHTIEWVHKDEVSKLITWEGHQAAWQTFTRGQHFTGVGTLVNSGEFTGMNSEIAGAKITEFVNGKLENTYRLRDWSIGRQRYWGVPVPIVYDPEGKPYPIPKEHLPWTLPTDVDHTPTGEPPLSKSQELKDRVTHTFGEGWTPDFETMDTFVDSSWYFLRYLDTGNDAELSSKKAQEEWMPIDIYFGGAEHTTMHLLYSRFWQKALYDLGLATLPEPYKKRINRGLVLGPDGNKMSKSKGNVIDPDEQVKNLGADTVKMYLAFMGPYGESTNYPWDMGGIVGIRRFLERVNGLYEHVADTETIETTKLLHKTIQKVGNDSDTYKFNTAISALMVFINHTEKNGLTKTSYEIFLKLIAPFAPHLSEELWREIGHEKSIHLESWPLYDESYLADDTYTISVQVNGKMRGTILVPHDAAEADVVALAKDDPAISQKITGQIKKVIFVPKRILSLILEE
jgi:leucyl-tRNA synthetase